jgi:phytoene dehydrogenase-like protein
VIVVGAGLAGLRAAQVLCRRGLDVVLLEAADRPGGRVATDVVDGFRCDRGFQVTNTSYPALRAALDTVGGLEALDLRAFEPAAAVRGPDGALHVYADPRRRPALLPRTALDGLIPLRGKLALGLWTGRVLTAGPRRVTGHVARSAAADLAASGVSGPAVERVLRPFLSGVLGETELTTSAAFVRLVWRSFVIGTIAVPAAGMGAIPAQLAAGLPEGALRLGQRVECRADRRRGAGRPRGGGGGGPGHRGRPAPPRGRPADAHPDHALPRRAHRPGPRPDPAPRRHRRAAGQHGGPHRGRAGVLPRRPRW